MRKSTKIVRKLLALFLVVLMSIESFGALVSDNDGSAFITKGEFDSLKSSFQSQIDNYNTSIDSKIDGAIAAYLAGVKLTKKENILPIIVGDYEYLESFGLNNQLPFRNPHILGHMKCIQGYLCHIGGSESNSFHQGLLDTDYSTEQDEYYNSVIAENNGTNFYNLKLESKSNIKTDLIAIGYDSNTNGNVRWDNPSQNIICGVVGYYWNGNGTTERQNMENQRKFNWWHAICTVINRDDWARGNSFTPQTYAFRWDSSALKHVKIQTTRFAKATYDGGRYNMLTGFVYEGNSNAALIGFGWDPQTFHHTASSAWIYDNENKTTLASFYNVPYTTTAVYWPQDLSKNYISMLQTDQLDMSKFKWTVSVKRAIYQQDDLNWNQPTNGRKYHVYPSPTLNNNNLTLPTTAYGVYCQGSTNNFQGVPYDWTYETWCLDDGYDQRNLNYFNTDILSDKTNKKLNEYLKDYTTSRGFPMYVIDKEGKIEISPIFDDATKKYKVWFTNGPALTDNIETTKPTNCYDITGANADGSITIQNGNKVTFEVEKDDIVYMSWTEENKKGGGKLKYPLEAVIES